MAKLVGFIVSESDAAVAFVHLNDARKEGVKPLWLPRKKIESMVETDGMSKTIKTAQLGERVGFPVSIEADNDFLEKVGFVVV